MVLRITSQTMLKPPYSSQIVKLDHSRNLFTNVIGDFNAENVTVFGRRAMTHWKPVMLVSQVKKMAKYFSKIARIMLLEAGRSCWSYR